MGATSTASTLLQCYRVGVCMLVVVGAGLSTAASMKYFRLPYKNKHKCKFENNFINEVKSQSKCCEIFYVSAK